MLSREATGFINRDSSNRRVRCNTPALCLCGCTTVDVAPRLRQARAQYAMGGRHGQGNALLGLERLNPAFSPKRGRRNSPSRTGTGGGRDALDICSDLLATSSVRTPRNAGAENTSAHQAGKTPQHPREKREIVEIAEGQVEADSGIEAADRAVVEAQWPNAHGAAAHVMVTASFRTCPGPIIVAACQRQRIVLDHRDTWMRNQPSDQHATTSQRRWRRGRGVSPAALALRRGISFART